MPDYPSMLSRFLPRKKATGSVTWSGPITITTGGTYTGNWESTSPTQAAVTINTSQPVTITNSRIRNTATSGWTSNNGCVSCRVAGARVTITNSRFYGGNGRTGVFENTHSLTFTNNTIDKCSGLYLLTFQSGGTISVLRNVQTNVQKQQAGPEVWNSVFLQFALVQNSTIEVAWNQVINVFGQSGVEDNISIFNSKNASIHDNYIKGAYPETAGGYHSGSGIMIGDNGGSGHFVTNNQVVSCPNVGIGIAGGFNNLYTNNKIVSDCRGEDGSLMTNPSSSGIGIMILNFGDPTFSNNRATGNTVGALNKNGARVDWYAPDAANNMEADNTHMSGTIDSTVEDAEWPIWLAKLASNNVSIGAP